MGGRGAPGFLGGEPSPLLAAMPSSAQPSPETLARLQHAHALREELDPAWAAGPLKLEPNQGRLTLLIEDPGGEPLLRLLGHPWEIASFLRLAIGIATAVGEVHQRGLIHKDIKPANVLVNSVTGQAWLMGFGIASRLPRERQAPAPPEVIAGTLAYMAPEQTGRMNWSIDFRSDLYAPGGHALRDAYRRTAVHRVRSDGMGALPHRSPAGAARREGRGRHGATFGDRDEAPRQECLGSLSDRRGSNSRSAEVPHGTGVPSRHRAVPLGADDVSDRLISPEKLYGREHEIETLLGAFDRVVANGATELVLVSGYAGIGKSSVVNEPHKALVPPRGLFASGKFDQYKRDIPYATLAQAFRSLVRPLLAEAEAELGRWKNSLSEALERRAFG